MTRTRTQTTSNIDMNVNEKRVFREAQDERIKENKAGVQLNAEDIKDLVLRLSSTQATILMLKKEQYCLKKQVLKMSLCIQKVKEETIREIKEAEREARVIVVSDYLLSDLKSFKGKDNSQTLKAFAYAQFKSLHQQLKETDLVFVKSVPSNQGRFRLVAELQSRQLACMLKKRVIDAGLKVRFGESKIYRQMSRRAFNQCNELNEVNPEESMFNYVVKNGHRIFRVYDNGSREELFTETSTDLAMPHINLDSPLYDFIGDSGEEDELDNLEVEKRMLEDLDYVPEDRSERVANKRKRRKEDVARVRSSLQAFSLSSSLTQTANDKPAPENINPPNTTLSKKRLKRDSHPPEIWLQRHKKKTDLTAKVEHANIPQTVQGPKRGARGGIDVGRVGLRAGLRSHTQKHGSDDAGKLQKDKPEKIKCTQGRGRGGARGGVDVGLLSLRDLDFLRSINESDLEALIRQKKAQEEKNKQFEKWKEVSSTSQQAQSMQTKH